MKVVIGLVGEKGGGKGTFTELLKEVSRGKTIVQVRFSDILTETLRKWNIPVTRANLQKLPVIMNSAYGEGALTRAVQNRVKKKRADIVILDGVRWKTDQQLIRSFNPNYMVYVTAKPRIRYERLKKRGEKKGEKDATYAQFMHEEKAHTEKWIHEIGKRADVTIRNERDLKYLRSEINAFYYQNVKRQFTKLSGAV